MDITDNWRTAKGVNPLGAQLDKARKERSMNASALADALGIDGYELDELLRGAVKIDLVTAQAISRVFGHAPIGWLNVQIQTESEPRAPRSTTVAEWKEADARDRENRLARVDKLARVTAELDDLRRAYGMACAERDVLKDVIKGQRGAVKPRDLPLAGFKRPTFEVFVASAMKARGLSVAEAALHLGVEEGDAEHILSGHSLVSDATAALLSSLLGVPAWLLVDLQEAEPPAPDDSDPVVTAYTRFLLEGWRALAADLTGHSEDDSDELLQDAVRLIVGLGQRAESELANVATAAARRLHDLSALSDELVATQRKLNTTEVERDYLRDCFNTACITRDALAGYVRTQIHGGSASGASFLAGYNSALTGWRAALDKAAGWKTRDGLLAAMLRSLAQAEELGGSIAGQAGR